MIENPYTNGDRQLSLLGYMEDGTAVKIRFEDKGDIVRGFRPARKGNVTTFEVWTTYWCIEFPEPRGPNGEQRLMEYVQVDQRMANKAVRTKQTPHVAAFRWNQDAVHLAAMGLVVDTLERRAA